MVHWRKSMEAGHAGARSALAVLTGVALVSFPMLALAAEAPKKGMPQLDFANPLTKSQVVWGGAIFLLLYLLLSRWALPRVASVLEERTAKIAGDLDAARSAKASADAAVAELTDATQRARAEAQAEINRAADRAKEAAAVQTAELNARLDAQLASAEGSIAAARSSAVHALRAVARDTADTVITRLTGMQPDTATVDRAVTVALAARSQA